MRHWRTRKWWLVFAVVVALIGVVVSGVGTAFAAPPITGSLTVSVTFVNTQPGYDDPTHLYVDIVGPNGFSAQQPFNASAMAQFSGLDLGTYEITGIHHDTDPYYFDSCSISYPLADSVALTADQPTRTIPVVLTWPNQLTPYTITIYKNLTPGFPDWVSPADFTALYKYDGEVFQVPFSNDPSDPSCRGMAVLQLEEEEGGLYEFIGEKGPDGINYNIAITPGDVMLDDSQPTATVTYINTMKPLPALGQIGLNLVLVGFSPDVTAADFRLAYRFQDEAFWIPLVLVDEADKNRGQAILQIPEEYFGDYEILSLEGPQGLAFDWEVSPASVVTVDREHLNHEVVIWAYPPGLSRTVTVQTTFVNMPPGVALTDISLEVEGPGGYDSGPRALNASAQLVLTVPSMGTYKVVNVTAPFNAGSHVAYDASNGQVTLDEDHLSGTIGMTVPWPAPAITSLSPSSGTLAGGTDVIINGRDFTDASGVTFDGIAAVTYSVLSPTQIKASSPPHGAGAVDVRVTAGGNTSDDTSADDFTYVPEPTRRFQQTDSRLYFISDWRTSTYWPYSGGSEAYTFAHGATVYIPFIGSRLDWIAKTSRYMGVAKVSLDGSAAVNVDLYSAATLYKQKVWSTGDLSYGLHWVKITCPGIASRGGGVAITLDAVDVAGTLAMVTRQQENNPALDIEGAWTPSWSWAYSAGRTMSANTSGSSATITFKGAALRLIASKGPYSGKAWVSVDGGPKVLIDLYSYSRVHKRAVYATGYLAPGEHTVTVSWSGQKNSRSRGYAVNLDAIDVLGSLVSSTE